MRVDFHNSKAQHNFLITLCHLIAGQKPPDYLFNSEKNEISENHLFPLLYEHQVIPLTYHFKDFLNSRFPKLGNSFFTRLASYSAYNMVRTIAYSRFLKDIYPKFEKYEIPAIIVKGLINGILLYESPYQRTFTDLDIIIPPSKLPEAHSLLIENNFTFSENLSNKFPLEIIRKYGFARHYIREKNPQIIVDLHLSVTNKLAPFQFNTDNFLNNSVAFPLDGTSVKVLSNQDHLIFLLHHVFKHYYFRLIWLIDLFLFLDKYNCNERNVLELIKKYNLQILWNQTFSFFTGIFGRLPEMSRRIGEISGFNKKVFTVEDVLNIKQPYTPSIGRLIIPLRLIPKFTHKLRFIFTQIFPPPEAMEEFYANESPAPGIFNYMIRRAKTTAKRISEYIRS